MLINVSVHEGLRPRRIEPSYVFVSLPQAGARGAPGSFACDCRAFHWRPANHVCSGADDHFTPDVGAANKELVSPLSLAPIWYRFGRCEFVCFLVW